MLGRTNLLNDVKGRVVHHNVITLVDSRNTLNEEFYVLLNSFRSAAQSERELPSQYNNNVEVRVSLRASLCRGMCEGLTETTELTRPTANADVG